LVGNPQDLFVQGRPWPFDPARIAIPVNVVGDRDSLLPKAHSLHTASLIPGANFKVLPGHGHLSILSDFPGLAAALAWPQGR